MPDTKITALAAITTVDPAADVLPIVDISDTSMAASGTTKKITSNQILGAGGTATLASATITGDLTVRTNVISATSSGVGFGINTAAAAIDVVSSFQWRSNTGGTDKLAIFSGGAGLIYLGSTTASALSFLYNGSEAMRLNATGLGVGNSSPAAALDLTNTGITASREIRIENSAVRTFLGVEGSSGRFVGSAANNAYFGCTGAFGLEFATNNNVRMVVDTSGNVGIGVTPVTGGKLTVAGPIVRNKGNATLTQNVATTVATLPGEGLFIAYAYTNASNPSAFTSYAVILCDSVGSRVIANNGTQISITTSTFALQVTQIFAATMNVLWSFVQIG